LRPFAQLAPLFVRNRQHRPIPSHNYQTDQDYCYDRDILPEAVNSWPHETGQESTEGWPSAEIERREKVSVALDWWRNMLTIDRELLRAYSQTRDVQSIVTLCALIFLAIGKQNPI
jgi:hypothetical protein